jgi:hypothetical protein
MGCSSDETPPPLFFVSVASKGFNFGVSSLDAIVAGGWVGVDSKADADERCRASNGSAGLEARVDLKAAGTEFAERDGTPHPGCFAQRVRKRLK